MSDILLPKGWVLAPITQLISTDGLISDGDWVESKDQDINGSVRLIQLADVGDGYFQNKSDRFMSIEKAKALNCTFLKQGDLLIARMPAPLGRACVFPEIGQKSVTVVDICIIRTSNNSAITNSLLTYWLNSPFMRNEIEVNSSGTTRKRITRKKLEQFVIPLPPSAEQKIIAEKLDLLLAQVKETKSRLERIPEILKQFRQSVLSDAVCGKLTEDLSKENYKKTIEWKSYILGDLAYISTGKTPSRKIRSYWENGNIPWLTSSCTGNSYTYQASQFITDNALKECSLKLFPKGTLLLAMYGEGKTRGQVTELKISGTCNQACAAIVVKENINREFIKICLLANYEETRKVASGGAQPNLNLNKVKNIRIQLPIRQEEQNEIVRRVEQLFAYADKIEQQVNAALEKVNNLTQSILAKAFRGELTAQWRAENVDLITGENSATALLEKIQAEREQNNKSKKEK